MKTTSLFISILLLTFFYSIELRSQIDTLPPLPIKNLIYPTVIATVSKNSEGFSYSYSLSNGANALQDIYSFMVDVKAFIKGSSSPVNWDQSNLDYDTIKVDSWNSEDSTTDISPGGRVVGFEIKSPGLPMVGRYWVAAWEVIPSEEGQYNDASFGIFATHLCRTTISPADPPNPFVPLNFLDTLASYTTQSRILGWIKDQATADKYLGYFSSAKASLQQNNIVSARATLQQVLQDVNADSTNNITSEAYALIRYNTEYLLAQLLPPPALTIAQLFDSLSAVLQQFFAQGLLGNKQFVQELERNIQDAKKEYTQKDSIGCTQELEDFQQTLKKEYLAKPKKNDKHYVNGEAYRILSLEAEVIIGRVLTPPSRTAGTIYVQINALQIQLQQEASNGFISGKLLVPALNLMLGVAEKQIQKKDTTGATLQIALFQQTVREVFELCQRHVQINEKVFVKPTGYISLYYRAKYILEQLTEPINQSLPKLEPELEKELQELRKESIR
jgi:hypothetical protein